MGWVPPPTRGIFFEQNRKDGMIRSALEKAGTRTYNEPRINRTSLVQEVLATQNSYYYKITNATLWSNRFTSFARDLVGWVGTPTRKHALAKKAAVYAIQGIVTCSSEELTVVEAVDYVLLKMLEYRTKFPESYQYDATLSDVQWQDRIMVLAKKLLTAKRASKVVKLLTQIAVMALALYEVEDRKLWPLPRTYVDVTTTKATEWADPSEVQTCGLCFNRAQYVVSKRSILTNHYFEGSLVALCQKHLQELPKGTFFAEKLEDTEKLRFRVQRANHRLLQQRKTNALKRAIAIEDQRTEELRAKVETNVTKALYGETIVKHAPLNPGYRWLRPYVEGPGRTKCLVAYCNAEAQVRITNNYDFPKQEIKYVCSQHLAQGIILGAVATVYPIKPVE